MISPAKFIIIFLKVGSLLFLVQLHVYNSYGKLLLQKYCTQKERKTQEK